MASDPCDVCLEKRPIMLAMEAGDGEGDWRLCSRCWRGAMEPAQSITEAVQRAAEEEPCSDTTA